MKSFFVPLLFLFLLGSSPNDRTLKLHFDHLESMPQDTYGMTYVSDGEYIYSIGGGGNILSETNDIQAYHIQSNRWEKLPINNQIKPFAFGWGTYLEEEKEIVFMGGFNHGIRSHGELTKTLSEEIYQFNVASKKLEVYKPNAYQAVDAGVAIQGDKMYMFGGSVPFKNTRAGVDYTNTFFEYHHKTGEWFRLPDMPVAKITKGKIVNDVLYVFGGKRDNPQKDIHQYDFKKQEWKKVGEIKHGVSDFSIAQYKDKIILVGDWRKPNALHIFDTVTKEITSLKSNFSGRHAGSIVVDGKLFVFGGINRGGSISNDVGVLDLKKIPFFN